MDPITNEHLLARLRWRYATKQFDPAKKIPDHTWAALEESLVLTPSSFGLQPWKFLVIDDPAVRQKLQGASWGQSQIVEASHLVVFAAHKENTEAHVDALMQSVAKSQNQPLDAPGITGYRKVIVNYNKVVDNLAWNTRQTYIALGNFMTSAALLGIDTCPLEGLDPAKYDEILGLPGQGLATAVACAAGYRAESDRHAARPKIRFPRSEIVRHI